MDRIPEPELMDDPAQARAYAQADFDEPHNRFIDLFTERFGLCLTGNVLDLGCGPGDICRRFARRYPECHILGIDASEAMLALGRAANADAGLAHDIEYCSGHLPCAELPRKHYRVVISNSLLHHLEDPATLWQSIRRFGESGTLVFIMDLLRPDDRYQALQLQQQYAADEPQVLQKDFFNSLLAAYRPSEVTRQLQEHGLDYLTVETVSDRHFIVYGRIS